MSTQHRHKIDPALAHAVRDGVTRAVAVVGLAGVALIHLLDAPDTFAATPYKGWLYVGLIVGSLTAAAALVRRSDPRAWAGAAALSVGAILAFVYSRTVGLPASADDIGNWTEPLGLASLFVESAVAAVALERLTALAPRALRLAPEGVR